jgi:hypothetical protein
MVHTEISPTEEVDRLTTPFDEHSTAEEVLADVDLSGRRAIVTGASSGGSSESVSEDSVQTLAQPRERGDAPPLLFGDKQVEQFGASISALCGPRATHVRSSPKRVPDGIPSRWSSQRWRGAAGGRTGQPICSASSTMIPSGPRT